MNESEAVTRLAAANETVAWARNVGDGTVAAADIDELTDAVNAVLAELARTHRAAAGSEPLTQRWRDVLDAYRKSKAKGYFRYPRGPVARALETLDKETA